jgi:uncharacterized protein (UPF0332 family)
MLRKVRPDKLKSQFSLKVSAEKLTEAKKLLEAGFLDSALLYAYTSMFHSGRALLFKDGISEKSHYCLIKYLSEEYVKKGRLSAKLITAMDSFRSSRHDTMYGLTATKSKPQDVTLAVDIAQQMLNEITNLFKAV